MSDSYKLSLPVAILININIMLGTGMFVNSVLLQQNAGALSPLVYATVGILLLPLVASFALLLVHQPEGNLYTFGQKQIGPLVGFISAWTYFVAKLASAGFMIHFCVCLLQNVVSFLAAYHTIALDLGIIALFTALNLFNMKVGSRVQFGLFVAKVIPIVSIVLIGLWYFQPTKFTHSYVQTNGFLISLPFALYAFAGFEAACILSAHIKDSAKNAPRAVLFSYLIAMGVYMLYQSCYYGAAPLDATGVAKTDLVPFLIGGTLGSHYSTLAMFLQMAIALSALGGAYGILFSNKYNLFTLAHHGHIPYRSFFMRANRWATPHWCVVTEALICASYLILTGAQQPPLQYISAFGSAVAYTIGVIAFFFVALRIIKKKWAIALATFALINCAALLVSCINGFIKLCPWALVGFLSLIGFGVCLYAFTHHHSQQLNRAA